MGVGTAGRRVGSRVGLLAVDSTVMARLDNDSFLSQLTHMLQESKSHGSVYITYKSMKKKKVSKKGKEEEEYVCLVRARLGSKKIRTEVRAKDAGRFQMNVGVVYRTEMDSL